MKKPYSRPLTLDELAALPDDEIDTSDIPELGPDFWENAKIIPPRTREQISLRLPSHVIAHFKHKFPKGYTSQMAAVLEAYVSAQEK